MIRHTLSLVSAYALKISNLLAINKYLAHQMFRKPIRAFTYQQTMSVL
jgi:hypothetical protein